MYTACVSNRRLLGAPYSGVWLIVCQALAFDYLWSEVRVKGGAYGCGFQTLRSGSARFYSYRDPRIDETFERFERAADWLASPGLSEDDLDGFVISTVSAFDSPLKPRELIRRQTAGALIGLKPEDRPKTRSEMVGATLAEVTALSPTVKRIAFEGARCVFGNKDIIAGSKLGFAVYDILSDAETPVPASAPETENDALSAESGESSLDALGTK